MNNKELYIAPTLEMILYGEEDIIHTSNPEQDEVDIDLDDDIFNDDDDYINIDGSINFNQNFGSLDGFQH